ncbi:MAG: Re/Si-specific NAD(P)(+) transhydrogenase subunit alpha [Candidatus Zixiibacteriota bacterium]|nr:MAG: Re/Si-specific NAD(P)(+) transhydrogenase subunit alpha [candidate division Zixibacteria bacterium]
MSNDEKSPVVAVPRETFGGERRVAIVPEVVPSLINAGLKVLVESSAGKGAGIDDNSFDSKGATIISARAELFRQADIILQVRGYGSNPEQGKEDLGLFRSGQIVIGFFEPLSEPGLIREMAEKGVAAFSMELMPRITRAQSMDALSSMANIAGYKAVLMAAESLPRIFPMMMTAAGTIAPARVFVIGAGVAGLQAIATAKRLGAIVKGYDIRPAVKEQVESLGGKFVELEIDAGDSEDKGGYARAMDEEFYRKQRELMTRVVAESDVVITTAAIPGKKAPILITGEMVLGMPLGSIVIDLAAERGGNCELTRPGETIIESGVTVMGPLNVPSTVPYHSSQMYAKNISTFLLHLVKEKRMIIDREDEITRETLLTKDGEVVHARVRELLSSGQDR